MHTLKSVALACAATVSVCSPAKAQDDWRFIAVASQPASSGVAEFARQANVEVVAPAEFLAGVRTHRVSGRMKPVEGLRRMLAGTNLEVVSVGGRALIVRPLKASRSITRVSVASAGEALPATAQDPPSAGAEPVGIEEVVVTARRREERLQDVPISVAAFSGAQLTERNVRMLDDLQSIAPGIRIEPQNNKTSTPQVTIRGQRMYGVLSAQDPPTAFYFADAAVAPIQGFNSAMYDLASIQVLKGPQGTLFGRNTTGGAVVITPAKPTFDDAHGQVMVRGGNYHTAGVQGFYNIPVSDTLALRFSAYYNEHEGYNTYISKANFGQKANSDRVTDLRFSALWRPTDQIENHLVAYYGRMISSIAPLLIVAINPNGGVARYNGTGAYAGFENIFNEVWDGRRDPREVYSNHPQYDRTELYGGVNTTTLNLGRGMRLKNIVSFRRVSNRSFMNMTGADVPVLSSFQNPHAKSFTEEFQVQGDSFWDGRVNWVAGLYYSQLKNDDVQAAASFYAPPLSSTVAPYYTFSNNRSYAAYAQATAKLTDKLSFTGGVRTTKDKRFIDYKHRTFDYYSVVGIPYAPRCAVMSDAGVLLPLSACSLKKAASYTRTTYTVSLDYKLTDDVLIYATQRTGYRSGGFNQRAITVNQRLSFAPETSLDREIGVKSEFELGGAGLRLNAAYFHDDYKNLQKTVPLVINGLGTNSTFNAASAKVQGIDVEARVSFTPDLIFGVNYAYTDTGYKKWNYLLAGQLRDFSDRKFTGIPKHQLSLFGSYSPPLPPQYGKLTVSADWYYQSSMFISDLYQNKAQISLLYTPAQAALIPDSTRPFQQRAYRLLNLRAELREPGGRPITLAAYVKNAANASPEIANSPLYETFGVTAVTIAPPRTWGVEITYNF